jgi:hypothetical protein
MVNQLPQGGSGLDLSVHFSTFIVGIARVRRAAPRIPSMSTLANKHSVRLITIYSFEQDQARIDTMQKASLGTTNFGVGLLPALVGSPEWWRATQDGLLARIIVSGTISRVYWGSMGDWPECEVTSDDGSKSTWTREGDISRYVEGLRAQIVYVLHPWKTPEQEQRLPGGSKIVLTVDVEESDRRSDPRAPGPGGIGLRKK